MGVEIAGIGKFLPGEAISNEALIKEYEYKKSGGRELSAQDITQRTGIEARYMATDSLTASEIAYRAGRSAIEAAGYRSPRDAGIDQIIVATSTPDDVFPPVASNVAGLLNVGRGISASDISDACSGFARAMAVAGENTNGKSYTTSLVIGADMLSRVTKYEDYTTGTLFGDGAGAVLLRHTEKDQGLLSVASDCFPDKDMLNCKLASTDCLRPSIVMEGSEVYRLVVTHLPGNIERALGRAGLKFSDVSRYLFHQANGRMLHQTAKIIGVNPEKVPVIGLKKTGNTSAASIPILMSLENERQPFEEGEILVVSGFGAGMNIETVVWRR